VKKIDVQKAFGAAIRDWRIQLGISQEELAERAELHRTYVSDVERGSRNISLKNIERLAHALEVSVATLFPESKLQNGRTNENKGNGDGRNLVDVLLVEDNPNDVELAVCAFKKARFANRVDVVRDGAAALDYIFCRGKYASRRFEEHPQVVLLDLNLPKIDGIEVLRRMKADDRTRMIPVIILTISRDNYDMAKCRQLGVESYIIKPVDFQRLCQATPRLNLEWALIKPSQLNMQA
jgi:CheY-like chemotaxis protein/DNA-binding XRE family transcriptional regulator